MLNKIATIIPPLIMLPNSLTASASVREISLIRLKGSMINVGCRYDFKYPFNPLLLIPKNGTAINTQSANAVVVESDAVGGV